MSCNDSVEVSFGFSKPSLVLLLQKRVVRTVLTVRNKREYVPDRNGLRIVGRTPVPPTGDKNTRQVERVKQVKLFVRTFGKTHGPWWTGPSGFYLDRRGRGPIEDHIRPSSNSVSNERVEKKDVNRWFPLSSYRLRDPTR